VPHAPDRPLPTANGFADAAVEATGLDDFGPPGWRQGLEVLVGSAAEQGQLSALGQAVFSAWVHQRLVNRLRLVDWAKAHPDECGRPVEVSIIITGLGRSGTTFFQDVLSADPGSRSLMKWETEEPLPPPEAATFTTDPRIARCVETTEKMYAGVPAMRAAHYEAGDRPIECRMLLGLAFRSRDFSGLFTLPSYDAWWLADDQRPAYTIHRLALSVLQSRAPGQWVLKDPFHLLALDVVLETYPDALVVVLHRDPVKNVASSAALSLAANADLMRVDPAPTSYWGQKSLEVLAGVAKRAKEARAELPSERFLDLQYDDLVADPAAVAARVYAACRRPFTAEIESAIADRVAARPQHQHGVHQYSAEQFGLTEAQIRERFEEYV
jgi:hypothetical protein